MRELLLQGRIQLPAKHQFEASFGADVADLTEQMFKSAFNAYLHKLGNISTPYWAQQFGTDNIQVFNQILQFISSQGWWSVATGNKFSTVTFNVNKLFSLEYITPDELENVRKNRKFDRYLPLLTDEEDLTDDLVKVGKQVKQTGLVRTGMAKAAMSQFCYDTSLATDLKQYVIDNVNKGMRKVREKHKHMPSTSADYDAVSADIVNYLFEQVVVMDMGGNLSDPRGRAVKKALSKVANPIGYKDFRAMMCIPMDLRNVATDEGEFAIHLFIAELHGYNKNCSIEQKVVMGKQYYEQRDLPELSHKNIHEIIWLRRVYRELDLYNDVKRINVLEQELGQPLTKYYWSTPIELDASASMLSYEGLLLGDERLLRATNTLYDGNLSDPWHIEGLARKLVKAAATPLLYGSLQSVVDLWKQAKAKDKDLAFTAEDLSTMSNELQSGYLGIANDLKKFIIRYAKPSEVMNIKVHNDEFEVYCNRHTHVMDALVGYSLFDSSTNSIKTMYNAHQVNVPDLKGFRTWFMTGLIHNLDSQVMNTVIGKLIDKYNWGLDIHDAVICCPEAAADVRKWYADELDNIFANRQLILNDYFKSIGVGAEALPAWEELKAKVHKVSDTFKASPWALK